MGLALGIIGLSILIGVLLVFIGAKISDDAAIGGGVFAALVIIAGIIVGLMRGLPEYSLWKAGHTKRILVTQAQAERDAAALYAQAEVERSKGVAEANRIIADSIDEQYLRYLFIQNGLDTDNKTVIYVPTEANLPILEAERLAGANKAEE